jgi:hypothetical protein
MTLAGNPHDAMSELGTVGRPSDEMTGAGAEIDLKHSAICR